MPAAWLGIQAKQRPPRPALRLHRGTSGMYEVGGVGLMFPLRLLPSTTDTPSSDSSAQDPWLNTRGIVTAGIAILVLTLWSVL